MLGSAGPIIVRHINSILSALGADGVDVPTDLTADAAMTSYVGVSGQIGLLVALGMCAAALAVDHRPGLAAFYRTRTCKPWQPRPAPLDGVRGRGVPGEPRRVRRRVGGNPLAVRPRPHRPHAVRGSSSRPSTCSWRSAWWPAPPRSCAAPWPCSARPSSR
ncbi:hypothetical protein ACU686_19435 [Yinghuangia aomiensis]